MRPTLKLLAVLGLALILTPVASAQITSAQVGAFGTQTRVGDADYTPLLKKSKTWTVAETDLGVQSDVTDNCVLLMYGHAGTTPVNKDIRLSTCLGKPAGTMISDSDQVEKKNAYTLRGAYASQVTGAPTAAQFSIAWADVDGSGSYNKGDAVYLVAGTPAGGDVLVTSTMTGQWTIRLTPVAGFTAGTFVLVGDVDFVNYHAVARTDKKWIVDEREDKGWYLMATDTLCCFTKIVSAADTSPTADALVAAGTPLPVNAIRLGVATTYSLQPGITVTGAELANADAAEAGKPLPVIVTITNNGATAGYGVIVTKLDKLIVDVRMSPLLSPGEFTKTIVTVAQVPHGGQQELEVNDVFVPITVKGAGAALSPTAGSPDVASTQAQLAELQGRLGTLEASRGEAIQKQGSPGVAPLAAFAVLAAVALALRRRAA